VTVDELLNVDKARIDEKITEYTDESRKLMHIGDTDKNLELWEKAYSEFPNDIRVMKSLMYALTSGCIYPHPEENNQRAIEIGKRILEISTDTSERESAVHCICLAYHDLGDKENALKYSDMGGSFHTTQKSLRCLVLDGEEGAKECQQYLAELVQEAAFQASIMVSKTKCSPEQNIQAFEFGINIIKLLFSDDNVGFYAHDLSWRYIHTAYHYAELCDTENMYKALEESTRYAVMESTGREAKYTAPLVNRLEYNPSNTTKNYTGNTCSIRLEELGKWKVFDKYRSEPCFITIMENLSKHAK